jgi:hypothetical protein
MQEFLILLFCNRLENKIQKIWKTNIIFKTSKRFNVISYRRKPIVIDENNLQLYRSWTIYEANLFHSYGANLSFSVIPTLTHWVTYISPLCGLDILKPLNLFNLSSGRFKYSIWTKPTIFKLINDDYMETNIIDNAL